MPCRGIRGATTVESDTAAAILGATQELLARVVAAVGLAQNLSALSALATEGIQEGHMALHARSLALSAGATGGEVEAVAARLREGGAPTVARARDILAELRLTH